MCFSALVRQDLKNLQRQFGARIDYDAFDRLFERRLNGEDLKICKALEHNFLSDATADVQISIRQNILKWRSLQDSRDAAEIAKQKARLKKAEKMLAAKTTKKAQEDQRISSAKIKKLTQGLERRSSSELSDRDRRIWPGWYFPMLWVHEGQKWLSPFRYHLRPAGMSESFDRKYNGNYNARVERLEEVKWWSRLIGKNHGVMIVDRFYENVAEASFLRHATGERSMHKNIVVSFDPGQGRQMIVPVLYDRWVVKGQSGAHKTGSLAHPWVNQCGVDGAAAITFTPPQEVKLAGHDRCIGRLKIENLDSFLSPDSISLKQVMDILQDHESFVFTAAAA